MIFEDPVKSPEQLRCEYTPWRRFLAIVGFITLTVALFWLVLSFIPNRTHYTQDEFRDAYEMEMIEIEIHLIPVANEEPAETEEEYLQSGDAECYQNGEWVVCEEMDLINPVDGPQPLIRAEVSAYNSEVGQTDDTPFITASGLHVKHGIVANNCLAFGTEVEIQGETYEVQDRMNSRYGCHNFDIWMESKDEALNWGRQTLAVAIR